MLKFGGPFMIPPLTMFLNNGGLLVIRGEEQTIHGESGM
jgi:hypothetical protein